VSICPIETINKEDVLEYIQSQAGKKFDPHVVEKFIVMIKAQKLIYQR
jgi:response regulator RpfG family c-di-GMP phosphodiesterase